MPFNPRSKQDTEQLLVAGFDDLFDEIPDTLRRVGPEALLAARLRCMRSAVSCRQEPPSTSSSASFSAPVPTSTIFRQRSERRRRAATRCSLPRRFG